MTKTAISVAEDMRRILVAEPGPVVERWFILYDKEDPDQMAEYVIRVFTNESYLDSSFNFEAMQVGSWGDNGSKGFRPEFDKFDDEAEGAWSGMMKWDACSHFYTGYNHLCGYGSAVSVMNLIRSIFYIASRTFSNWDEDEGFVGDYDPDFMEGSFDDTVVCRADSAGIPLKIVKAPHDGRDDGRDDGGAS